MIGSYYNKELCMSIYRCDECDGTYDADYHGCQENPKNPLGLICEDCDTELGYYDLRCQENAK